MYRVRSTDIWFNAPGIVAAYQPVAAPGPLAALQNVSNDARRPGMYAATPGTTAPTFASVTGWTFSGTQYLSATWTPNQRPLTYIARIKPSGTSGNRNIIGGDANDSAYSWDLTTGTNVARLLRQNTALIANASSGFAGGADTVIAVTYSAAGVYAHYLNGAANGSGTNNVAAGAADVANIGAQRGAALQQPYSGSIMAVAVFAAVLSPVDVFAACRQMAYCHVNPDWSAWGRRRRYYYAPALLAAMRRRMPGEVRVGSRGVAE